MQIITDQFQKEMKEHGNYIFPLLVSHERLSGYESGSFLWHWHPEIELTLITKGQMIYQVNNHTFHLHEGEALFGNAGTLHTGFMHQHQDCEYTAVTFEPRLIYGSRNSLIFMKYIKPIIQNFSLPAIHFDLSKDWHTEILTLLSEIIRIESERYPTYELDLMICLEKFWQLLFLHTTPADANMPDDKRSYDRIRAILAYIEENYAAELTLEAIANSIHLCKSECCRFFKKYMNLSLFDFILQYRIEKSVGYLTDTKYSVTAIAEAVGFHDSNYYSKVFRRYKGCSPTKYRSAQK